MSTTEEPLAAEVMALPLSGDGQFFVMSRKEVAERFEVAAAACLRRPVLIVEDGQPDLVLASRTEWENLSRERRRPAHGHDEAERAGPGGEGTGHAARTPGDGDGEGAASRTRRPTAWEQLATILGADLDRVEAVSVTVGEGAAAVMSLAEARPYLEGFGFHADADEPWEGRPTWGRAHPFVAWTPERAVFPLAYDGMVVFRSVPRHPGPVAGLMQSWP